MSLVGKVLMAPQGPKFSKIVQGYWRLAAWNMSAQERLSFLKQHVELGISTVDNAAIYGDSERLFGEALKLDPSMREQIQLVSKFGINGVISGQDTKYVAHYDSSKKSIIASVERSLQRLGVEQLDALLVHRPDFLMDAGQVADAFGELKNSGKVQHFGVSNFNNTQFSLLQSCLDKPLITNQIEINPLNFSVLEDGSSDLLQQHHIHPMAWSCLAGGAIFNEKNAQTARLRHTFIQIAEELGTHSMTQVIFTWVLKHPSGPVALVGSGNIKRVKEAAGALQLQMTTEQWYRIWVASKGHDVA
ncbi:aldo/keto reductase [Psychromonas sp. CNPT3]|uniref:aldo/keto reductase n=1 Tax=Psychromonas sp. CNPT3 TaxID=314282 RepID=UPI00006E7106|nr:aldo/keto reductase [Psychromonas sp. CNPT3]AGH82304.1 aldo/keto reductase [Psychromonas sp. CNPT3]